MTAFHARRNEDIAKLRHLEQQSGGRVRLIKVSGDPISQIQMKLIVRTAADDKYPAKALNEVDATIQLGARYPFEEPSVSLGTKVFNPNVYTSGRVCLGSKWLATEFLDLLARRLFKILAFDESIINTASAANGEAARWYVRAKSKYPTEFPSDLLSDTASPTNSSMKWKDKSTATGPTAAPERVTVVCPNCRQGLRLPKGRSGTATCPSCKHSFSATT
jgi:ubiquitin-protein ligase